MSQKLESLKEILTSLEKGRELSYKTYSKIIVKNYYTFDNSKLLRNKYLNIHNNLNGVNIYTSFSTKTPILRINIYNNENIYTQWLKEIICARNEDKINLFTIFKIINGKNFIKSLLIYIDNVKSIESETYSKSIQKNKIKKILENSQKKFGKDTFSFELTINRYFKDNINYYTILNEEDIEITNIQIFNGIIKFFIKKKISLEEDCLKSDFFSYYEKGRFGILSKGKFEKKFIIGKNGHYIFKESLNRDIGEYIDFTEMIDILEGRKGQDKFKMVDNAVRFANTEIEEKLKIKDFFLVEERAYKRQYDVKKI